jgi:hypothetical protein
MYNVLNQYISSITHHENGSVTVQYVYAPAEVYNDIAQVQMALDQFGQQFVDSTIAAHTFDFDRV